MKLVILGSEGMLGRYITKYFSKYFSVIEINRKDMDAAELSSQTIENIIISNNLDHTSLIINCIAIIKLQIDKYGVLTTIKVNSIFPRLLSDICEKRGIKVIHITTDGVFSGKKGNYTEKDLHDATDVYGKTKSLGEPENCIVIRACVIGEEIKNKRSLVEWAKSNKKKEIKGFINHLWNGMTCLQLSKIIHDMIIHNHFWAGIRNIYTPEIVSKSELLFMLNKEYKLDMIIRPVVATELCDRSLSSIYNDSKNFNIPSLKEQISEMKSFSII